MQKLYAIILLLTVTALGKPDGNIEIGGYGEVYNSSIDNTCDIWITNIYPLCRYFIGNSVFISPHYNIRLVNGYYDYFKTLKYINLTQYIGIKAGYKGKINKAMGIYLSAGVADNNYSSSSTSVELPKHVVRVFHNEFAILLEINITYAITENISFGMVSFLNAPIDKNVWGETGLLFGLTYLIKSKP